MGVRCNIMRILLITFFILTYGFLEASMRPPRYFSHGIAIRSGWNENIGLTNYAGYSLDINRTFHSKLSSVIIGSNHKSDLAFNLFTSTNLTRTYKWTSDSIGKSIKNIPYLGMGLGSEFIKYDTPKNEISSELHLLTPIFIAQNFGKCKLAIIYEPKFNTNDQMRFSQNVMIQAAFKIQIKRKPEIWWD